MLTSTLCRTAALAAVAAAVLMAPGAALAAHDIKVYKMEENAVLEADIETVNIACKNASDKALDGMWRIDQVDQISDIDEDTPQAVNTLLTTGVEVKYAKLNGAENGYTFQFAKTALGRAQIKVFITCIEPNVDTAKNSSGTAHTHAIQWGTPGSASLPAAVADGLQTVAGSCGAGEVLVSPDFEFTSVGIGTPYMSYPTVTTPQATAIRQRTWGFNLTAGDAVTVTWKCLRRQLTTAAGENHKLVVKWRGQNTQTLTASTDINDGKYDEAQAYCGKAGVGHDGSKALVSGWYLGNSTFLNAGDNVANVWYLGQDPRLKSRAFKVLSDLAGQKVTTGVICFNDRTT